MEQKEQSQEQVFYSQYGKDLYRLTGNEEEDSILNMINSPVGDNNSASVTVSASDIGSGVSTDTSQQASGTWGQGKTGFDNTTTGFIIGFDPKVGLAKFYIGTPTQYFNFDGTNVTVSGSLTAGSLNIPDSTTANSFHVDSSGNTWWGASVASGLASANASVANTGVAIFKSVSLSGTVSISGIANNSSTDISLMNFSHNLVFSSASATQINWASGTIVMSNGRTFSISSGNTGTMSGATYIYLDTAVSSTVLQTTATYSTANGANKILIATAQNNTTAASVIPFGGGQPVLDGVGNIAAASITAGSIAASTITGNNIATMNISGKTATFDTGTIGGFTMSATQLTATNFSVTSGAANTANVTVGTGATAGGLNSANASTDIVFWAGSTFANRATAPFTVDASGRATATGISTLNKKAYTNFETAGRFINTTTVGNTIAPTYGNQGVTLDTTAAATRWCRITWYIANTFTNNPTFVATLVVNAAPPGTGQAYIGLGQPTVDGTGHTFTGVNVIGFEIVNVLGSSTLSIRGVVNNSSGSIQTTSYIETCTTNDVIELFLKVSGGNTATFYTRKNGGVLSAGAVISSQVPTGAGENSLQFSVSNQSVANQTQIILQCAAYEH